MTKPAKPAKKPTPARTEAGLTLQEERFCQEYIIDLNGTQAAIRAGYAPEWADRNTFRMMARPRVAARIAELQQTVADKAGITALGVLIELRRVLLADPRLLYDDAGNLRPIKDLPDDVVAAISSIKTERRKDGRGEEADEITVSEVKRWDKLKAGELLMKHLGLLIDRTELTGADGGAVKVLVVDTGIER